MPDSPDSCPRGMLEQALCQRLCTVVSALHELSQSALPEGPCTEATLKVFVAYSKASVFFSSYLHLPFVLSDELCPMLHAPCPMYLTEACSLFKRHYLVVKFVIDMCNLTV